MQHSSSRSATNRQKRTKTKKQACKACLSDQGLATTAAGRPLEDAVQEERSSRDRGPVRRWVGVWGCSDHSLHPPCSIPQPRASVPFPQTAPQTVPPLGDSRKKAESFSFTSHSALATSPPLGRCRPGESSLCLLPPGRLGAAPTGPCTPPPSSWLEKNKRKRRHSLKQKFWGSSVCFGENSK